MDFAKLSKKIMGSSKSVSFQEAFMEDGKMIYPASSEYYKRGGHGGANQIDKIIERAKKCDFVKISNENNCSPDGYHSRSGYEYHHPSGHRLTVSYYYGAVAYENSFKAVLYQADDENSLRVREEEKKRQRESAELKEIYRLCGKEQTAKLRELGWRRRTAAEKRAGELREFFKIED